MIMIYKHKLIKIKINKDKLNKLHTQGTKVLQNAKGITIFCNK